MIYNKWIIYQNKLCYNWRHKLSSMQHCGTYTSHCLSFESTPICPKFKIRFCTHCIWNVFHCLQVWQYLSLIWWYVFVCWRFQLMSDSQSRRRGDNCCKFPQSAVGLTWPLVRGLVGYSLPLLVWMFRRWSNAGILKMCPSYILKWPCEVEEVL